jgi:hypothetical protein
MNGPPPQHLAQRLPQWNNRNNRNNQPAPPFKGPSSRRQENQSTFNSGYIGRRRPKSYHGRARRMEVLGEEEDHETDAPEEFTRGRDLRPAKSFEAGDDVSHGGPKPKQNVRPKSVGAAIVRAPRAGDVSPLEGDMPPIPRYTSWSEQERIWRARREEASRQAQQDEASSRESSGQSNVTTWPEQDYFQEPHSPALNGGPRSPDLNLPVISARASPRPARSRPQSEVLASKSQPDLRGRNEAAAWRAEREGQMDGFRGSYEGQAVRAQRISQSPRIVPTVMKRGAKEKRYTYDEGRAGLVVDV